MSEYRATYKCRLCGEEFVSGAITSILDVLMTINDPELQRTWRIK